MDQTRPTSVSRLDWLFRVLGFIVLTAMAFTLPSFPANELDASWRMALGKYYLDGLQFGTDAIFTYGPLGWTMGKTYWGGQWASLIAWHAVQAVVFTSVLYWNAFRLQGYARVFFLGFFFIFGMSYEDAAHQIVLAFLGIELIRRSDRPWEWVQLPWLLVLAVFSLVKFTDLLLSLALVLFAAGLGLWERRKPAALIGLGVYLVAFVVGWALCGQDISKLPRYFYSSWEISQGYQDAMFWSCPKSQLITGLVVLGLLVVYTALNLFTHPRFVRGGVLALATGAFVYLSWKHGFIRADGHQIGFYYAALTLAVSSPLLLEDSPRLLWLKRSLLVAVGLISLVAMDRVLPGVVRGALGGFQHEVNTNISFALGQSHTRDLYELKLNAEKNGLDLMRTRALVGNGTVDVLGYEQAVALYNGFNYRPRPVFQGYKAYSPYLSRLNGDFLASDRAPDFLLFKLQSIDYRLAVMDDPHALRMLVHRYRYVHSELGFTVWQRKPGPFDPAPFEPMLIKETATEIGAPLDLSAHAGEKLWIEIDYRFNLLGQLRRFFFKPPLVQLRITDAKGFTTVHRLPRPIGRAGFMINPVVDDLMEFMRSAGGTPRRTVASIEVVTSAGDRDCLQDAVSVRLFRLPPSDAGVDYFKEADKALFHMFMDPPSSFTALNPPNEDLIDKRKVMIMHAPSEMVFDVPAGATELHGQYGFIPGAYSDGGRTNGAEFVVYASAGGEPSILHERYLDPVKRMNDRGLQKFSVKIPPGTGQVFLRINPGPYGEYAFDWTGWTGIEFR